MEDKDCGRSFDHLVRLLTVHDRTYRYYSLTALNDPRYVRLPFCIRVLLESAVRGCDGLQIQPEDVQSLLDWRCASQAPQPPQVAFKPGRVLLQDLTGVPAVADLVAMREAVRDLGGDPSRVQPLVSADLVIDHSVQVDFSRPLPPSEPTASVAHDIEGGAGSARSAAARRAQARVRRPQRVAAAATGDTAAAAAAATATSVSAALRPPPYRPPHRRGIVASDRAASPTTEATPARGTPAAGDAKQECSKRKDGECACKGRTLSLPTCQPPATPIRDEICPFHEEESAFSDVLRKNQELEFERNSERFQFLKWGSSAFEKMRVLPPGSGIAHQVNLEYLARLVIDTDDLLRPDLLVGTDAHTTMINGLGVLGWGVGGLEAEAALLGQPLRLPLPQVVGCRITGHVNPLTTATDIVLTITKYLRQVGVAGKFVEFFGPGVGQLSIADRATISNMCPEYGAVVGFFPTDQRSCDYLLQTGRDAARVEVMRAYLLAAGLMRDYSDPSQDPDYSAVVELNLSSVVSSVSGPKRPQDRVAASQLRRDFLECLPAAVGYKGFGVPPAHLAERRHIEFEGKPYSLGHGSVVIAAITSCTNTSNPSVMLAAGLLAQKAVERGLSVPPWIKTSLSPGSGVVTNYLQDSGVMPALRQLGFGIVGYGCMTCVGNSGPLPRPVSDAIREGDLVCCGVLSGNRNFEGRIHPETRANYLASPPLVVAYALAGRVDIDFETTPLGVADNHGQVFLREIWPSREEIHQLESRAVIPAIFARVYSKITKGNASWAALPVLDSNMYDWDPDSSYIQPPTLLRGMPKAVPELADIESAHVLLVLGDNVTTDHISPAGSIARTSPAARYLSSLGLTPRQFNSYGSRRGCEPVMARATFANVRLQNRLIGELGGRTIHIPSGQTMDVYDVAVRYAAESRPLIVLAGKQYGCGSPRDWAAKGAALLGVRAVLAESFDRVHRGNLVAAGVLPLQFRDGDSAAALGLTGRETLTVRLPRSLTPQAPVTVQTGSGASFEVLALLDTQLEVKYYEHGGLLRYIVRQML